MRVSLDAQRAEALDRLMRRRPWAPLDRPLRAMAAERIEAVLRTHGTADATDGGWVCDCGWTGVDAIAHQAREAVAELYQEHA